MSQATHLLSSQNELGEGPLWHIEEQTLYWVDIQGQKVESFRPEDGQRRSYPFPFPVTALGLREGGGFVIAARKGLGYWDPGEQTLDLLGDPEPDLPENRFNDGAVGPGGCFWAGTMHTGPHTDSSPPGSLYRLEPGSGIARMDTGLTISNGLGWSPDQRTMYFTDSLRHAIYAYDYDSASGEIENKRTWLDSSDDPGVPDGLTVDSEGFVWSARWGGWKITRYDPDGKAEREVDLPVECPTSCTFGGPDLTDLYITSAWTALKKRQRRKQPLAGDIFRLRTNVKGQPVYRYKG